MANKRICPDCGKTYEGYPAISRKNNRTKICPDCGQKEAWSAFMQFISKQHAN